MKGAASSTVRSAKEAELGQRCNIRQAAERLALKSL